MPTYAFRDPSGDLLVSAPEFAMPIPVHAQIAQAQRAGGGRRQDAAGGPRIPNVAEPAGGPVVADLVTDHGLPRYYRGPVPRNARALVALAESAGFETKTLEHRTGHRVEGYHAGRALGFTATWERGRAKGATWNTPWRYGIVKDSRPVGVNAKTRTGLAGKRAAGMGATRLAILGTPWGVPITHSELTARLQEETP